MILTLRVGLVKVRQSVHFSNLSKYLRIHVDLLPLMKRVGNYL